MKTSTCQKNKGYRNELNIQNVLEDSRLSVRLTEEKVVQFQNQLV